MTDDVTAPTSAPAKKGGLPSWAVKTIAVVAVLILAVIAYFILAAFLPRWWAQQVGSTVNGNMGAGSTYGIGLGVVCTIVSLLLLTGAWAARKWKGARFWIVTFLVLAVVASVPNLLTLTVVAGGGNGSHAGERIMDVQAPGFRAATLIGVVIGAVIYIGVFAVGFFYRGRRRAAKTPAPNS